jgi:hypothetical protein
MKTEFLDLDCFLIEFTYEHQKAEPEVGYLVPFWSWDVKAVYVVSDLIFDEYDILDILSVEDLIRIDEEIEEYLNNK